MLSRRTVKTDTVNWRCGTKRSILKTAARKTLLSAFGVTERLPPDRGILLTFDDGPHPDVTPDVLDLLAKYNAQSVFFVVGNRLSRAPHLLRRILAEGHSIGNHTFRHLLDSVPRLADYRRDIEQCQSLIETHTGSRPILFRPPLGAITPGSLIAPRMAGLRTMLWSVDINDWRLRHRSEAVEAGYRLAENVSQGDIVLLHDDNRCVIDVLETALPRLLQKLYPQ
jgi:peptidoglycan-N-acetylglucosamine deacetylase